jgi:hypothetical protein
MKPHQSWSLRGPTRSGQRRVLSQQADEADEAAGPKMPAQANDVKASIDRATGSMA